MSTGQLRELWTGHTDREICLAYSPDGQTLATGSVDRRIKLWDTGTDQEIVNLSGHQGGVTCLAFSPDGRTLASGGGGEMKFWDVATKQELISLVGNKDVITCIAFSPDGKTLASAAAKSDGHGEIRFWRTSPPTLAMPAAKEQK